MATAGIATLDFGGVPGTNRVTSTVTGQAGILSDSHIEAWLMGATTATHNAYEHTFVPMDLRCSNIVAGTGFDIIATTNLRLNGTFICHWVWS
jgi:hypothetical protein